MGGGPPNKHPTVITRTQQETGERTPYRQRAPPVCTQQEERGGGGCIDVQQVGEGGGTLDQQ